MIYFVGLSLAVAVSLENWTKTTRITQAVIGVTISSNNNNSSSSPYSSSRNNVAVTTITSNVTAAAITTTAGAMKRRKRQSGLARDQLGVSGVAGVGVCVF